MIKEKQKMKLINPLVLQDKYEIKELYEIKHNDYIKETYKKNFKR